MRELFSYDNKFMQALMIIGDMIILNFLFLLCCLPIVTIGAAQAGLYNGLRVLVNKEDDSSCAAAFFRGFKSGIGTITIAFTLMLVLIVLVGYTAASVVFFQMQGQEHAPVWLSVVGLCICALFQSMISIFHSRFTCTVGQLFKNVWLLFLAHPLRCILVMLLTWSPVIIFLVSLRTFVLMAPIMISVYFSFTFMMGNAVIKKPFDDLIEMYNERIATEKATQEETV